ncbi:MAG: carboxypeptidase regulatory-like domain-containing protein, partial [Sphingobacteriaceae bacterium]
MHQKLRNLFAVLLLIACCLIQKTTLAQTSQAGITGTITDEKKEVIPGATVQVRNESTGFNTATVTNLKGEYIFKQLPLGGPYTINVTFIGYGTQKRTGYTLNLSDLLRLDVQMQVATNTLKAVEVRSNTMQN